MRLSRLLLALLFCLFSLLPLRVLASEGDVSRITTHWEQGVLVLDADIDLTLSGELREAANKGVPLYFTVDLEIDHPRWWWFDTTVIDTSMTWRIQYNALTRRWRVGTGPLSLPAATLDEALDLVRHIRDWSVGTPGDFSPATRYEGRLRLRLDTSRLARPFQVDALNSNTWSLTTPWKAFTVSTSAAAPHD